MGGTLIALILAMMFRNWARDMRLDADDKVWLANAKKYAVLEEEGLPRPAASMRARKCFSGCRP